MRRLGLLPALLLIALGWNLALGASAYVQHLPRIANGQALPQSATICDGAAPLLNQDTGDLDVTLDANGRFLVARQDRSDGSRIKIDQHIGASLQALPVPVAIVVAADIAPAFSPSGQKHGSVALVPLDSGRTRVYYTRRTPENEALNSGPYGVWCLEF